MSNLLSFLFLLPRSLPPFPPDVLLYFLALWFNIKKHHHNKKS